jgi:hypothetical protein
MKQAVVDRYLNDLAYSLDVERDALNVVSIRDLPFTLKPYHQSGCSRQRFGCRILCDSEERQFNQ